MPMIIYKRIIAYKLLSVSPYHFKTRLLDLHGPKRNLKKYQEHRINAFIEDMEKLRRTVVRTIKKCTSATHKTPLKPSVAMLFFIY